MTNFSTRPKAVFGNRATMPSACLLVAFLLSGCHHAPRMEKRAEEWISSLSQGRAILQTLRAEAKIEFRHDNRTVRFHASLLVKEPDRVYAEVDGFGLSSSMISVKKDNVFVYVVSERTLYQQAGRHGLEMLLGIPIHPTEWVPLLLGAFPSHSTQVVDMKDRGAKTILTVGEKKDTAEIGINARTGWVVSFERPNEVLTSIVYGDPMETWVGLYPSRIRLETQKGFLDMKFSHVEADPKLTEDMFDLVMPQAVQFKPLKALEFLRATQD